MTTQHGLPTADGTADPGRAPKTPLRKRRGVLFGLLATASVAAMLAAGTPASAATQGVRIGNDNLSVRDCYHPYKQSYPSQSCTFQATLEAGLAVTLVCQTAGQGIGPQNDVYWDYVVYPATAGHGSGEGYVADWYVNTNVPNAPFRDYNVPLCSY